MALVGVVLAVASVGLLMYSAIVGQRVLRDLADVSARQDHPAERPIEWDRSAHRARLELLRGHGAASALARRRVA